MASSHKSFERLLARSGLFAFKTQPVVSTLEGLHKSLEDIETFIETLNFVMQELYDQMRTALQDKIFEEVSDTFKSKVGKMKNEFASMRRDCEKTIEDLTTRNAKLIIQKMKLKDSKAEWMELVSQKMDRITILEALQAKWTEEILENAALLTASKASEAGAWACASEAQLLLTASKASEAEAQALLTASKASEAEAQALLTTSKASEAEAWVSVSEAQALLTASQTSETEARVSEVRALTQLLTASQTSETEARVSEVRALTQLMLGVELNETNECIHCLDAHRTHTYVPCGHMCVCEACSSLQCLKDFCPICREKSTQVIRVFL
jgi:Zinc finger, C3HC4 type (RING finger)